MSFGLTQPVSSTIIVNDNEQLSEILAELDDAPARLDALELRAGLLESSDVTIQGRLTSLETRADDLEAADVALDGRTAALEGRADALEAADVALDGRVDTLEVFDAAAELRLDDLEARATALEAADVALDGRADTLEAQTTSLDGRVDALETQTAALDGRADTLETQTAALAAADTALDGRVDTLETQAASFIAADTAIDLRADALEAADVAFADADAALDARVTALEGEAEILAAGLAALRGLSGPLPLSASSVSPSERWTPLNDRKDVLQCTVANGVCRVWMEIGNLQIGYEYSLEIRLLLRDGGAAARRITAQAFLVPVGTQVTPPVEVQFGSTVQTPGIDADVVEVSIQGALLGDQTPARLLVELTSGTQNSPGQPYQCTQVFVGLTEVGPI